MQVKRRSYGVLLDHLIPSLTRSWVYEELAVLDELIQNYEQAEQQDPAKLPYLEERLWELVQSQHLDEDLQGAERDFPAFVKRLHVWLEEIKSSLIKDGLHVFGQVSEGERFIHLMQALWMRVFGCPPGTYGGGVDVLINSRNWQSQEDLGNVYTRWSGYAYGRKLHGRQVTEVFARRLAEAEATIKNESSQEIDMLEDDCYYIYHGGLIAGITTHSGKAPRSYSGDARDPERPKVRDIREETARIMRARIFNPKWFAGLQQHGYKGAQEIAAMVDIAFGWDATAQVLQNWMYDQMAAFYLFNEERREWIREVNPWALHQISERLLEAAQRGMWEAEPEALQALRSIYLESEGDMEGA
ncbi:cobaltochelatase subunit CobN [Paradesulfitobacterium ferrireducens]|uniref:cobaltochelatase subunit CobN n=1 Tax=Paradesulfitobacterium ferrireducens TaxID=2816476 RepID=UPI002E2C5F8D|nr:cobaltochelatase subunit CobN [Paradesulfitobacterium ferrireducens]